MRTMILSAVGAAMLLAGCAGNMPGVIELPYTDGNTTRPATELMQIERTDSSTVLTLMVMYDYFDTKIKTHGDNTYLSTRKYECIPLRMFSTTSPGRIEDGVVSLTKGVPFIYQLKFPALPEDAEYVDLLNFDNGRNIGSIWGIDLTGKRSANEYPAEIPAKLLNHDFVNDTLPRMVFNEGTATVNLHAVAWREWMNPYGNIYVNTIADKQEKIKFEFNDNGNATVEIPLKGTANISVHTSVNTYASTYVDPGETIDLYLLPNNNSEAQRYHRPSYASNGKYRNIEIAGRKLFDFFHDADTLLLNKTNPDDYFTAIMKIHKDGLDSIAARNFPPYIASTARAGIDKMLMYQTVIPDRYTCDWEMRNEAKRDSISRFTPAQLAEIRSQIDFTNPLLELKSIGNPGNRTLFLEAKKMLK